MTRVDPGDWPVFGRSEIGLQEVLAQLHEWLGESVRVEVVHRCEVGYSSFYGKLAKVEAGRHAGEHLIHFDGHAALVTLNVSALKAFRITGTTGRTGWIEFESCGRPILEIGLADADEVWARLDRAAA
jgi:hypothetical protein